VHTPMNDGSTPPTVSMRVVNMLIQAVEQLGVTRVAFLKAAGLSEQQLEVADARLPRSEVYRICELALDQTGDPALGLHWAERVTRSTFVPISYLMAHAASLGDGIASLAQFGRLLSDDPRYEFLEDDDTLTIRCLPSDDQSLRMVRFSAEMMLSGFLHIFRAFHANALPRRVSFAYAAPSYHQEYARIFADAALFEQPFTGIVFDRRLLATASLHEDEELQQALHTIVQRRMPQHTDQSPCALRVRELLAREGWPKRPDMETVASTLGLSVRSLRRRLADEGKSYRAVENDAFAIVAMQRLRDERGTIQEAADELGFSDTTAFHRAFKRATGTTPMKYREQQRAKARHG